MKTILSLGAGVQSSTIAMMDAHGEFSDDGKPVIDCCVFANTGAEPQAVYEWLDWLEKQLPFPVYRVQHENGLRADLVGSTSKTHSSNPPFFSESMGGGGMLRRKCTADFKVRPIIKKVRELVGLKPGQRAPKGEILVEQWIGISLDEIQRMKEAPHPWIRHRWPLIEKRMTRGHCLEWMSQYGYPEPPRSACTFCPYRSNKEWRLMRVNDQQSWGDAIQTDEMIRDGISGTRERLYVHNSLTPLAEADLSDPHKDQITFSFMDECDGLCGV